MSRRSRRRNRSRSRRSDSWRRSYDRSSYGSYSRSRSPMKSRRTSRDRRSSSRGRRVANEPKRSSVLSWDHRKHSEAGSSGPSHTMQRKRVPPQPHYAKSHRFHQSQQHRRPRYRHATWAPSNKYESEEFKSQKLQRREEYNQKKGEQNIVEQRKKCQLAELTLKLKDLVAQLSLLPKDSADRPALLERIQDVKNLMTDLRENRITKPDISENDDAKLLFTQLPESALEPGKLSEWIIKNSGVLLPKQIAMLASTPEGAVIQYNSRETAEMVLDSCMTHQIKARWASDSAEEPKIEKVNDDEVDYNFL